jgi:hypothetical protein
VVDEVVLVVVLLDVLVLDDVVLVEVDVDDEDVVVVGGNVVVLVEVEVDDDELVVVVLVLDVEEDDDVLLLVVVEVLDVDVEVEVDVDIVVVVGGGGHDAVPARCTNHLRASSCRSMPPATPPQPAQIVSPVPSVSAITASSPTLGGTTASGPPLPCRMVFSETRPLALRFSTRVRSAPPEAPPLYLNPVAPSRFQPAAGSTNVSSAGVLPCVITRSVPPSVGGSPAIAGPLPFACTSTFRSAGLGLGSWIRSLVPGSVTSAARATAHSSRKVTVSARVQPGIRLGCYPATTATVKEKAE